MKKSLDGRVVLITGSSIGIGRASALMFAEKGARVVVTYFRDKAEGLKTAEECKKLGAQDVLCLKLDVLDDKSIESVVERVVSKFKRIDVLVNNAGVLAWKRFAKQSFSEIKLQVRTNLEGLIKMTSACLPFVKDCVINIASEAGKTAYPDLSTYSATKFGVRGFTQALALESKLRIYSVNPDLTSTRMTGFEGRPPEQVAGIIVRAAEGSIKVKSGSDIDVWKLL